MLLVHVHVHVHHAKLSTAVLLGVLSTPPRAQSTGAPPAAQARRPAPPLAAAAALPPAYRAMRGLRQRGCLWEGPEDDVLRMT